MIGNSSSFPSSHAPYPEDVNLEGQLQDVEAAQKPQSLQHPIGEEEFYHLIFSQISQVFFITDGTGVLLFISPNIQQALGYSQAEFQEKFKTISQLLGDNSVQTNALSNGKTNLNIERKIADKMGQERTFSISIKPMEIEGERLLYTCRDITPRQSVKPRRKLRVRKIATEKRHVHPSGERNICSCHPVETKLHQSTEFNPALEVHFSLAVPAKSALLPTVEHFFTFSLDMLCIAGFDGYFKRLNPCWENTLGFSQDELLAKPYLDFVHPEDRCATRAEAQKLLAGTDSIEFENRYRCQDGSYKWLRWKAIPLPQQQLIYAVARDVTHYKQAEEELREQEAILRSFYNSSPLMMGVVELLDDDIVHLSDNQTTAQFFGTTPDAMRNQLASQLGAPPAHIHQWMGNYQQSEHTSTPVHFEYQHYTATDFKWLSATVCFIGKGVNRRSRFSYVVEDITARKQSEETLKRQLAAVEAAMDGIAILNAQQEYIYLNESHARLFGYDSSAELLGKTWRELYYSNEIQRLEQAIEPILWQTGQWHGEAIGKKRDGSTFFHEVSLTCTENGGSICVCRDISDRKHSEDQLRWDKAFLRSMTSASPLAFYVVDNRTDGILYFNHRFCEIWGIEHLEEAMQRGELKNNDIIPDCIPLLADVAAFAQSCKPLQTEENRVVVEDEIPFVGGRTIRRFSAQIRDEGDRYFGRLYMFEEITERKQAEKALRELTQREHEKALQLELALQELQHAQAQLVQREKMASLGQLVAGVAHEINNPTSFIYGNIHPAREYAQDLLHLVELYQRHYPNPVAEIAEQLEQIEPEFIAEDFPNLLDSMKDGAERITQIVLSLRNFSRLDETECKQVNIHEGIDNTLLILRHRLKQQPRCPEIQVMREYGQLPLIKCYPGQLNQVFMNIISNAIDAIASRFANDALERWMVERLNVESSLELNVKDDAFGAATYALAENNLQTCNLHPSTFNPSNLHPSNLQPSTPWIRIRTEVVAGNRVVIRIADNGGSIPVEIQPRLFDPFFTTKPPGQGTGLGLSISYQIVVERHKGKLWCHSAPERGTEFVLELPIIQH